MTTDVNAGFDAQRASQIQTAADRKAFLEGQVAQGLMRKNSNGTYTVLSGYDRGEVFNELGEPQHGLDTQQDGTTAFYSKDVPAWHSLGHVIPGGAKTTTDILKYAGQAFGVKVAETPFLNPVTKTWGTVRDSFTSYRTDTGEPFGTMGKRWVPLQNTDAFSMLDELTEYMPVETAGTFDNGRRTFVSAKSPEDLILDENGLADPMRQYVMIVNHHDGRGSLSASVTPWRPRCKNTVNFGVRDAVRKISIRHTKNAMAKVSEAKQVLGLVRTYFDAFAAEENALIQTPFFANQVDALIDQVWGELGTDPSKRTATNHANRRDAVHQIWEVESARCGFNAYAAENAITGYVDHHRGRRTAGRMTPLQALGEAVLLDANTEPKQTAHDKLMLLVK